MKDITNASSVTDVRNALQSLHVQHDAVTVRLETSIHQHDELSRNLRRLDLSRARLSSLAVTARSISHGMLFGAASTAKQISESVERLDVEQARVKATLDVVEQVAELKSCILGVVGSMGAPQDWENAAEYVHRASQIPADVVRSGFAEAAVPTAEVPDPPSVTLDSAAQSLCQLFLREFDQAVEEADGAKITRFFKMFPLIGRSKEGLDAYGRYVCQGVAIRARTRLQNVPGSQRRDGFIYANTLTKLFEHIAQVIDGHSGLVERHYGVGTMVKVLERLHGEADVQGGIILDTWSDERTVDRRLTDVKSYAFSFLVQSFLPAQKAVASTGRPQSPAIGGTANASIDHADDSVDMKEVDQILNEVGAMLGRWSLYVRFISARAITKENPETNDQQPLSPPSFIAESNLPKKVSKTLVEPFKTFTMFFLRRSVEKAFQLDEGPSGLTLNINKPLNANPPFITSAVDDVMYVVNQVLQRALATSHAEIVIATSSMTARVLGSDFIGMIQRKMRDESYPKAAIQGGLPPEDKVISFLVLTNNLDIATDYVKRIVRTHAEVDSPSQPSQQLSRGSTAQLSDLFPMGRDAYLVRNALRALENGFVAKATELNNDGIAVIFQQVIKPRMRSLLADAFREAEYTSSGDSFDGNGYENGANEEEHDVTENGSVRARLQAGWEALTRPMKRILSERNFERLLSTIMVYLGAILERRILSYHGRVTELGAVALERDIVDIVNVTVKGENFKLREYFTRCLQIVTIMNLEDDEWGPLKSTTDDDQIKEMGWVLDESERCRARTMVKGRS